jgi:hypothetical protein
MNQNIEALIQELEDDTDLLTRSDQWLEEHRKSISNTIDTLLGELNSVLKAINIKRMLQDKNLVAIPEIDEARGQLVIKVMKLRDAINTIEKNSKIDHINSINSAAIIAGINQDGYDIQAILN